MALYLDDELVKSFEHKVPSNTGNICPLVNEQLKLTFIHYPCLNRGFALSSLQNHPAYGTGKSQTHNFRRESRERGSQSGKTTSFARGSLTSTHSEELPVVSQARVRFPHISPESILEER